MTKDELQDLLENSYIVPNWCGMSITDHFDGMGGCWGVSSGYVARSGRKYCVGCDLYKGDETNPPGDMVDDK